MLKFSSSLNLELITFVIFWGFLVRITGSGDGCGANWPLCPQLTTLSAASLIEFAHRLSTTGLVFFFAYFAIKAWSSTYLRKLLVYIFALILLEAFVGALIVVGKLPSAELDLLKLCFYGGHIILSSLLLIFFCITKETTRANRSLNLSTVFKNPAVVLLLLLGFSGSVNASLSVSKEFQELLLSNQLNDLSYFQKLNNFVLLHLKRVCEFFNINAQNLDFFNFSLISLAHSHLALACALVLLSCYWVCKSKLSKKVFWGILATALSGAVIPLSFGHIVAKITHVFFYLISIRLLTNYLLKTSVSGGGKENLINC